MKTPARWLVLTVRLPPEDPRRELVGAALLALGGLAILQEGEDYSTYLPPPERPEPFRRAALRTLAEQLPGGGLDVAWRWQPNEDWEREWRRGLRARRISPRLVVKPTWAEWEREAGETVVEIDPEMAFGTGEHATTRGCLRLVDSVIRPGDRVLDVGSGSGILSIAAALLGAGEVVAVESDPDANLNARDNLVRNGVADRVELREALADATLLAALGGFDVILANILSGVIRPLLPAFAAALRPGGRLIVSGILLVEREAVIATAGQAGLIVRVEDREEEWWSAVLAS